MKKSIRDYYQLTKPGIIYGNALTVIGGFFLASRGHFNWILLTATVIGISLVIASGCVFNNYIDRDIDALMARTRKRALVQGTITNAAALFFAAMLGILGALTLSIFTNLLTLSVALVGLFAYVVVYSLWSKRHTMHATIIGAISGAVPPVVGYCAVSNTLDIGAVMLFLILIVWQVPHALAIAIYRFDDYAAAAIPVTPISQGIWRSKLQMIIYTILFAVSTLLLSFLNLTGHIYLVVVGILDGGWLVWSIYGLWMHDDKRWARIMFFFSLILILAFCIMLAVDTIRA